MSDENGSAAAEAAPTVYTEALQAVRKEILNKLAVGVVAGVLSLMAITVAGWWLYFKPQIVLAVGGLPRGAVVAFDRDDLNEDKCPDGWSPFKEGRARAIVGSGNPASAGTRMGSNEDGTPLNGYVLREHGGKQVTKLTIDEMPMHTHGAPSFGGTNSARPGGQGDGLFGSGKSATDPTGGGKPFTNMPPFIALYLCKKVEG